MDNLQDLVRIFDTIFIFALTSITFNAQHANAVDYSNTGGQFQIPNLLLDNSNDVRGLAKQALELGLSNLETNSDVQSTCLNHTEMFLRSLTSGDPWAFQMIDAMGKPGSGIMEGNLKWLGSYDECFATEAKVNDTGVINSPFTGRYCLASYTLEQQGQENAIAQGPVTLMVGICMPSSCNSGDTKALLNTLLSLLPINKTILPEPKVDCKSEKLEFDTKAIIVIVICSIFGLLMAVATVYDVIVVRWVKPSTEVLPQYEVIQEKSAIKGTSKNYGTQEVMTSFHGSGHLAQNNKASEYSNGDVVQTEKIQQTYRPGKLGQTLLAFSVYTNGSKILSTNQPSGTLTAVHGIRFISMTWVIFGHSFGDTMIIASNMGTYAQKMFKRLTFQVIENGTLSVDTFFTLSGLLVAYLGLKEMEKRGGVKKFKWGMFYFHRFWRLTPPYMLFLMFYVSLLKYFYNGPLWTESGLDKDDCKNTWWKNLLYVNNLIKPKDQCMGWGWYLANDMQFFIISPLMFIPLYYSSALGTVACLAMIAINFISVGVIASRDHLNANLLLERPGADSTEEIYVKPWCRIGPYAVGVLTGYVLYKTNCKLKIPTLLNLLGWLVAIAVGLLVVYGLYDSSGYTQFSNDINALYLATHRTAWGLAVCWVIFSCATGNGGFANTLLSWKALIPLSRLTYCAYLVHLVVMYVYFMGKRSVVYLTDLEQTYFLCGNLCISYAVAFIVSLAFEAPMMGLEKALLGRGKNS